MVEERDKSISGESNEAASSSQMVYNQPAGHVECHETILDAALREALEETAWRVTLDSLVGIYHYSAPNNGIRYVRVCFAATAEELTDANLDPDIMAAHWLELDTIKTLPLRSPLVLKVIEDYEAGQSYPLSLIQV